MLYIVHGSSQLEKTQTKRLLPWDYIHSFGHCVQWSGGYTQKPDVVYSWTEVW